MPRRRGSDLSGFRPSMVVEGIPVYTAQSFQSPAPKHVILIEPPREPAIVYVHELNLLDFSKEGHDEDVWVTVRDKYVLLMHGDKSADGWVQLGAPRERVEDILARVERSPVRVSFLDVCNPGGFSLDGSGLRAQYLYSSGMVAGPVFVGQGRITTLTACDGIAKYSPLAALAQR